MLIPSIDEIKIMNKMLVIAKSANLEKEVYREFRYEMKQYDTPDTDDIVSSVIRALNEYSLDYS